MTLIALAFREGSPAVAIGDLALSSEHGVAVPLEFLPFQQFTDVDRHPQERTAANIVSLTSKVVTFGQHMILWAGSYFLARTLIRRLFEMEDGLDAEGFRQAYRELQADVPQIDLSEELSLIYCRAYGSSFEVSHLGCNQISVNGTEIIYSGSGGYIFDDQFEGREELDSPLRQIAFRLHHLVERELTDDNHYWFGVGGGYEIAVQDGGSWVKKPYNVVLCAGSREFGGPQKILSLSYAGFDLIIDVHTVSLQIGPLSSANGPWNGIMGIRIDTTARAHIRDFLRREGPIADESVRVGVLPSRQDYRWKPFLGLIVLIRREDEADDGESSQWYHLPSLFAICETIEGWGVGARAFGFREIEEWYYGVKFQPLPEDESVYAEARLAHSQGFSIADKLEAGQP